MLLKQFVQISKSSHTHQFNKVRIHPRAFVGQLYERTYEGDEYNAIEEASKLLEGENR